MCLLMRFLNISFIIYLSLTSHEELSLTLQMHLEISDLVITFMHCLIQWKVLPHILNIVFPTPSPYLVYELLDPITIPFLTAPPISVSFLYYLLDRSIIESLLILEVEICSFTKLGTLPTGAFLLICLSSF